MILHFILNKDRVNGTRKWSRCGFFLGYGVTRSMCHGKWYKINHSWCESLTRKL